MLILGINVGLTIKPLAQPTVISTVSSHKSKLDLFFIYYVHKPYPNLAHNKANNL